jgi:hypothetical protein
MTEHDPNESQTSPSVGSSPADTTSSGAPASPAVTNPYGTYEPASMVAPLSPVTRPGPRSRMRWGIALLVAAVVVGVSAAGAWLLTGRESASGLAAWMPADSVTYEELRFDLPGDQRQKLGTFLAHFPGFDDQAILDQKLAEVYDRVIQAATKDKHNYSSDIKPWFGGQTAFALGGLPQGSGTDGSGAITAGDFHALAAISTTDPTAASAWLKKILDEAGTTYTTADHAGTQELILGASSPQGAVAVRSQVMLIGDRTSVERSLDANGSGGLAASDAFRKAQSANDADRLLGLYVDVKSYLGFAFRMGSTADPSAVAGLQSIADLMPAWLGASVRAEGDALVSDYAMPHNDKLPMPANAPTTLADHLAPSTLFVYDVNDYGSTLVKSLDLYRSNPALAEGFKQVEQAVGILGGFDQLLGWVGESAAVVDRDGSTPIGGLVVVPKDRAAADRLGLQIKNLIALGGGVSGISTRDEQYAGTTITIADLGDLSRIGGSANLPISGHAELAWAITDQLVVFGVGDGFVKRVLDTKADASLGSDPRFKGLVDRVGDHNALGFADLTAVRSLVEGALPSEAKALYEKDYKPYLEPFDAFVFGARTSADLDSARVLVTVK